mgnify:CR=1 FL=1
MRRVIFYSWQSDLPNPTNRGFIQDALENVATAIASDNTVAVEPVVDRDTQGVAGAPDIASTIFAKITAADVFVADISIISHPKDGRATPNPNVLIELGAEAFTNAKRSCVGRMTHEPYKGKSTAQQAV